MARASSSVTLPSFQASGWARSLMPLSVRPPISAGLLENPPSRWITSEMRSSMVGIVVPGFDRSLIDLLVVELCSQIGKLLPQLDLDPLQRLKNVGQLMEIVGLDGFHLLMTLGHHEDNEAKECDDGEGGEGVEGVEGGVDGVHKRHLTGMTTARDTTRNLWKLWSSSWCPETRGLLKNTREQRTRNLTRLSWFSEEEVIEVYRGFNAWKRNTLNALKQTRLCRSSWCGSSSSCLTNSIARGRQCGPRSANV